MRLFGLSQLTVSELSILDSIQEDGGGEMPGVGGFRRNEASPISKAYHSSGMSQDEIAKKTGVHASTISRYKHRKESDIKRRPSFSTLKKLADVVGKPETLFPELR